MESHEWKDLIYAYSLLIDYWPVISVIYFRAVPRPDMAEFQLINVAAGRRLSMRGWEGGRQLSMWGRESGRWLLAGGGMGHIRQQGAGPAAHRHSGTMKEGREPPADGQTLAVPGLLASRPSRSAPSRGPCQLSPPPCSLTGYVWPVRVGCGRPLLYHIPTLSVVVHSTIP